MNDDAAAGDSVGIGSPLPNFTVTLSDGSTVSTADLQGAPSVIVFFHTLCGDCRRELPVVERFSHEFPGVRFLCIARSQGKEEMAKIFYQEDCNLSLLEGKTIAIIGYGSQGHAHALNLKDSGCNVIIGLYEGSKSWQKAVDQGFEVYTAAEASKKADIIMILINDERQAAMYKNDVEPNLEAGNMLMFAHGFCVHFGQIVADRKSTRLNSSH